MREQNSKRAEIKSFAPCIRHLAGLAPDFIGAIILAGKPKKTTVARELTGKIMQTRPDCFSFLIFLNLSGLVNERELTKGNSASHGAIRRLTIKRKVIRINRHFVSFGEMY